MKRKNWIISSLIIALALVMGFAGCKKKSETTTFELSSLKAGSIDLNTGTGPSNVPVNATITAVFSMDVNASTATNNTISLNQLYDTTTITVNINVTGSTITITPTGNLSNGAKYSLVLNGIKSTNGDALPNTTRSFTTEGTFVPAGAIAYWNFENNANDQVGSFSPLGPANIIDITYEASRNAAAGMAAKFNGSTSLIQIPNGPELMNTQDFSLSFWVYEDSTGRRDQFTMGLAAWFGFQFEINNNGNNGLGECKLAAQYSLSDGTSASQDLWFNAGDTMTTFNNGGWQGFTYCRDLTSNNGTGVNGLMAMKWSNVVCTYDHVTKIGSIFINGEIMKTQDFNLYGDTHPLFKATGLVYAGNPGNNNFVFGFIQDKTDPTVTDSWAQYSDPNNNHFKGMFDDVRIFHKVLTPNEISLMYNSER